MSILIDGYNLLNATGIVGRGRGPGGLERSRLALLNFLAASLDPEGLPRTTVVFDAQDSPPGLPRSLEHRGLAVRFAARDGSADELIGELIRADSAPRQLVVVSSDHAVQRAARRRRATAVDSEVWYDELVRARRRRAAAESDVPERPAVPLLTEDVDYWLRQFGGASTLEQLWGAGTPATPREPAGASEASSEKDVGPLENPFPPGYGEDLLREM
jgi:uncharacterized protein